MGSARTSVVEAVRRRFRRAASRRSCRQEAETCCGKRRAAARTRSIRNAKPVTMMFGAQEADELSEREQALSRLPLPYSLALRLRDAGVAADVICLYVNLEVAAMDGFYRIAEAKLLEARKEIDARPHRG